MTARIDSASVRIPAPAAKVFDALVRADARVRWQPPEGMAGEMLAFDFMEGGGYRMRLRYLVAGQGALGKTTADTDEVQVRFVRIVAPARIEEVVRFDSEDPAYAGAMAITWLLAPEDGATRVTVRCENVPVGIDPQDHETALASTLQQLAAWVGGREGA